MKKLQKKGEFLVLEKKLEDLMHIFFSSDHYKNDKNEIPLIRFIKYGFYR